MCGIAGYLSWEGSAPRNVVAEMCQRLKHRGPDGEGIWNFENIVLGHRRLAILDLSEHGQQPLTTPDQRYSVVYNGEIYNHEEIKKELKNLDHHFKGHSDTETLLHAFIEWGPACLQKFNGMWAIAIWDNDKKELFLARDRLGQKPLYYLHDERIGFIFASEINAFGAVKNFEKKINLSAQNCFLALGYILSPMTIYEGILQLEASHYLILNFYTHRLQKVRYWNYAEKFSPKHTLSRSQIKDQLREQIINSIRCHTLSDVPIGSFLSGGIDSSSIVAILTQTLKYSLKTFNVGFAHKSYDERSEANEVAKIFTTDHYCKEVLITKKLLADFFELFASPFGDNSALPMMELSQLAATHVKVVLSGDGADEIFAGYKTYLADKIHPLLCLLPKRCWAFMHHHLGHLGKKEFSKIGPLFVLRQLCYGAQFNYRQSHYSWRLIFTPEERVHLLGPENRDLVYDTDPFKIFNRYYQEVEQLDRLDQHLYVDAMTWLPDDILVKVDRTTMRYGLEARAPYLDHQLVEFVAAIPSRYKLSGKKTKSILKETLENILPSKILQRPKSGFNAPMKDTLPMMLGVNEFQAFVAHVHHRWSEFCEQ